MSVQSVIRPVLFKENTDDPQHEKFKVFFQTTEGDSRVATASNDFRHFTPDKPAPANVHDIIKSTHVNDTVSVDGIQQTGQIFMLKTSELQALLSFHAHQRRDAERYAETMRDDAQRYADLSALQATLTVHPERQKPISDKLIGVFFEDISCAADGGLYAEMVQNRDFEYSALDHDGWNASTAWNTPDGHVDIRSDLPLSINNPHYAVLRTQPLANAGFDGIAIEQGKRYRFSFYARCIDCTKKTVVVELTGTVGQQVATAKLRVKGNGWKKYTAELTAKCNDADCHLILKPQKTGSMAVDMVSLFPFDTFKGRQNGLRRDLAQAIADLRPKFVRFPGGCMSHGDGIDNIYHWNHTVGPLQDRRPDFNIWHYHQTRGLGFYEYFQFCEDIGAEPLPVLAAGVPCQNSRPDANGYGGQQGGIPLAQMPAYIDELCNLIEWANGDPATSRWARMRAEAGHPEPFHLKYIGIGNEDLISTAFEERCLMIAQEIHRRYPDIQICGTAGPFHAPSSDYIEGWRFAKDHRSLFSLIDEHYYESTGWFMHNLDYYDHYDRQGPKVYIGEYASRTRTLESALAEAIFLCHVERNADIVEMTSYAPLLAKDGHHNWNPNMIYFTNTGLKLTPSYHTQRLFGNHSGDTYLASTLSINNSVNTASASLSHRLAASVVRNSQSGRVSIKLVNALPATVSVTVDGLTIPASATSETFSGHPQDISVTPVAANALGSLIVLQPYSFTVIDL